MISKRCRQLIMHIQVFKETLKRKFFHFTHAFWVISIVKSLKLCVVYEFGLLDKEGVRKTFLVEGKLERSFLE